MCGFDFNTVAAPQATAVPTGDCNSAATKSSIPLGDNSLTGWGYRGDGGATTLFKSLSFYGTQYSKVEVKSC